MVPCLTCPHKWSRPRPLTRRRAHLSTPTPAGTNLLYVCIQHVFESTSGIYLPSGLKNHQGQPVLPLEMMQCQNVSLHVVAPRRDENLHQADAMRSPQRSPVKQHLPKTPPPGMPLPPPATTPPPSHTNSNFLINRLSRTPDSCFAGHSQSAISWTIQPGQCYSLLFHKQHAASPTMAGLCSRAYCSERNYVCNAACLLLMRACDVMACRDRCQIQWPTASSSSPSSHRCHERWLSQL